MIEQAGGYISQEAEVSARMIAAASRAVLRTRRDENREQNRGEDWETIAKMRAREAVRRTINRVVTYIRPRRRFAV